jgi:hypothetical protein
VLEDQRSQYGFIEQVSGGAIGELNYIEVLGPELQCFVRYPAEKIRPASGCPDCLVALSMFHGAASVPKENAAQCASSGWDGFEGSIFYIGMDLDLQAYTCSKDCDLPTGTWQVAGEASPRKKGFDFIFDLSEGR